MTTTELRQQLQKQIDRLPDEIVEQIADFTLFIMARRRVAPTYAEWQLDQWQTVTLEQFFREPDEVEYTLKDAKQIYHP
jgi:hypothetical protein